MSAAAKQPTMSRRSAFAAVQPGLVACRAALAVACSLVMATAGAATVEFGFSGSIPDDPLGVCGSSAISNCGPIFVRFTFDSSAADGSPGPSTGQYTASGISVSFGGTPFFAASDGVINAVNFADTDQYGLLAIGSAANGSTAVLSILLEDPSALAFGSDGLPLTPAALTALLPGHYTLFADDDSFQLQGTIDAVECMHGCGESEVPEPGSAWLAAAGLATINRWRRRRSA